MAYALLTGAPDDAVFVEFRQALRELDEFSENLPPSMSLANKRTFHKIADRLRFSVATNFTDPAVRNERECKARKATKGIRDLIDNTVENHRYL